MSRAAHQSAGGKWPRRASDSATLACCMKLLCGSCSSACRHNRRSVSLRVIREEREGQVR